MSNVRLKIMGLAMVAVIGVFMLGDYLELWGGSHYDAILRPQPVQIRVLDRDTKASIAGAKAACYCNGRKMVIYYEGMQLAEGDGPKQFVAPQSDQDGIIGGALRFGRSGTRTYLFDKGGPSLREVSDWNVVLVLTHPEYRTKRMASRVGDLGSGTIVLLDGDPSAASDF